MNIIKVNLNPYQSDFILSKKRYPALISAIGTGKTYTMLLKVVNDCMSNPGSLYMIVRKEFTDLRDSTIKDFERYFQIKIDSNKEYKFKNGSTIMFRHGAELAVLKNINLSGFAIEQAEEFETDETFTMLRDRLRNPVGNRQGIIISNACGHNWIWKLWINKPAEEYFAVTATTFDNAHNLPKDFIDDLKRMKDEAPNHYNQYVMNSFEEVDTGDRLLTTLQVFNASKIKFDDYGSLGKILSVDVARYGDDETVFCVLDKVSDSHMIQIHQETWRDKSLMEVCGKVLDLKRQFDVDLVVVDDVGMGGGVTDRLKELNIPIQAFVGNRASTNPSYNNLRSESFFKVKEFLDRGFLKIIDDDILNEQLLSLKFKFKSDGKKCMVSKDDMRKEGIKSPDRADALAMACTYEGFINRKTKAPKENNSGHFVTSTYDVLTGV